jgi:hypothetical protein
VILRASDNIEYGTHKNYLGIYSGAFPSAELTSSLEIEVVQLEEDSVTLMLLLKFMHPEPPPNVWDLSDAVHLHLADAAYKYMVYGAMDGSRVRLKCVALP